MKLQSYHDFPQFVMAKSPEVVIIHRNRDYISGLLQSQLIGPTPENTLGAHMQQFLTGKDHTFREYSISPDLLATWMFRVKTPYDPELDSTKGNYLSHIILFTLTYACLLQ